MIELLFIACLTTNASACGEQQILQLPDVGLMGCMVTAQAHLAQWTESHPGYRIAEWKCSWSVPGERDI